MLEIKTIAHPTAEREEFDAEVNKALAEGWELVRRDIIPPYEGSTYVWERILYAELEREVETEEEDEDETDDGSAKWVLSRNPAKPCRCSACGFEAPAEWFMNGAEFPEECPNCGRYIRRTE